MAAEIPDDYFFLSITELNQKWRGKEFSEIEEHLYLDLYEQTRLERERAFQKSHDRRTGDHWPIAASRT